MGDLGLIPAFGRFPGEGNNDLLQYWPGLLEKSEDRGACQAKVQGASVSQIPLSDFHVHLLLVVYD